MKTTTSYRCENCGWASGKWVGRCLNCQEWGSVVEQTTLGRRPATAQAASAAIPIAEVPLPEAQATTTGIGELDRVLGGGLVPGSVVLLTGEPGIGKSTLLLAAGSSWASSVGKVLYVSAEESAGQLRLRADRTTGLAPQLFVAAHADLARVAQEIETVQPSLTIIDSVQTLTSAEVDGVPGGVTQVRAITAALVQLAKSRKMPMVIVGHVTKDGSIAGPRTLEHLVDAVLSFDGDRQNGFRMIRTVKNRFGPADEVGCFSMSEKGIVEVPDPSGLFTSGQLEHIAGTCLSVSLEGRRPLLTELQSLVVSSAAVNPRRVTSGVDSARVAMMLAVLQRKANLALHNKEVYLSTVGGVRVQDPALDAAICVAIASSSHEQRLPGNPVVLGEVSLSGEIRRVSQAGRRLEQAARLGFRRAIVPNGSDVSIPGLEIVEVGSVLELMFSLGLLPRQVRSANNDDLTQGIAHPHEPGRALAGTESYREEAPIRRESA